MQIDLEAALKHYKAASDDSYSVITAPRFQIC